MRTGKGEGCTSASHLRLIDWKLLSSPTSCANSAAPAPHCGSAPHHARLLHACCHCCVQTHGVHDLPVYVKHEACETNLLDPTGPHLTPCTYIAPNGWKPREDTSPSTQQEVEESTFA